MDGTANTRDWRERKTHDLTGLERRAFAARGMQLREQADGTLHLTGYASVTGVAYEVGWYQETIERGAFKRTLGEHPDVQLLINHTGMPLARTMSGTLSLSEDDHGLKVEADLDPEDHDVQSLARKMRRGDIDQMSFAFQVTTDTWNADYTARTISVVSIHRGDVSVVNQGANAAAMAELRAAQQRARTQPLPDHGRRAREILATLRAGGPPSIGTPEIRPASAVASPSRPDSIARARRILEQHRQGARR